MKFKLRTNARYFSNKELLSDLKRVAKALKNQSCSTEEYSKKGKFSVGVFQNRFKSWNNALKKAGLKVGVQQKIPDKDLFDNLESLWRTLGRQPFYSEARKPLSKYSTRPYDNRFGSWMETCKAFIKYKKKDFDFIRLGAEKSVVRSRNINEKIRLRIFKKDHYKCVKCGKSPATHIEISLHLDHKKPFSKGGSNNIENLQTLCNRCNLGKGAEVGL